MHAKGYEKLRQRRASIQGQIYHLVSRTHQRKPFFANWDYAVAASSAFTSRRALQDAALLCWALMPDHVHWLLQLGENSSLSIIVARMKSISAKKVRETTQHRGPIWYPGFYDRAIRREEDIAAMARYIVANPLRAGVCNNLKRYPFWDAVYL